jgi:hypothetical protein
MPRATNPALTAVDSDGDDFVLDFGMTDLPTVRPATTVETDKVAAKLARDLVANHFRAEHYGLL